MLYTLRSFLFKMQFVS